MHADDADEALERVTGWRRGLVVAAQVVASAWSLVALLALVAWLVRIWLDRSFPEGLVRALDEVGLLLQVPMQVLQVLTIVVGLGEVVVASVQSTTRRGTLWVPALRLAGACLLVAGVLRLGWSIVGLVVIGKPQPSGAEPSVQMLLRSLLVAVEVFVTLVAVALAVLSLGLRRQVLGATVGWEEDDR